MLAMNESKEDGHPVSRYFTTQILLRATLSKVVLSNAFCWVNLPCRMWAHYFLAFEAPRMYCTNEMKEKSKEIMNLWDQKSMYGMNTKDFLNKIVLDANMINIVSYES